MRVHSAYQKRAAAAELYDANINTRLTYAPRASVRLVFFSARCESREAYACGVPGTIHCNNSPSHRHPDRGHDIIMTQIRI